MRRIVVLAVTIGVATLSGATIGTLAWAWHQPLVRWPSETIAG